LRKRSTLIESENQRRGRPGLAGNAIICSKCGAQLNPKRGSRRQLYCSYRCRPRAVIQIEVVAGWKWLEVISLDAVRTEIARLSREILP